jgi:hypothetical protein
MSFVPETEHGYSGRYNPLDFTYAGNNTAIRINTHRTVRDTKKRHPGRGDLAVAVQASLTYTLKPE